MRRGSKLQKFQTQQNATQSSDRVESGHTVTGCDTGSELISLGRDRMRHGAVIPLVYNGTRCDTTQGSESIIAAGTRGPPTDPRAGLKGDLWSQECF